MNIVPVITIDGPSSAGKGTLCKAMAELLQWNILDSGVIYRVLALTAQYNYVDITSEEDLVILAMHLDVQFLLTKNDLDVILNGRNISKEIRTQKVANDASKIAIFPRVRQSLLFRQRAFRKVEGLIADGRDMGTIVFPDAPVKIFLNASLEERVKRRMLQLHKKGFHANFKDLLSDIKERDDRDCKRLFSPLVPADDALILDSTDLTIEQVIERALQYSQRKLAFV